MKNTLRFLFVGALLASAGMTGCGSAANTDDPPPPTPDMAEAVKACDTGDFCATTLADQTMELAALNQDSFMVKFNQGYTGQVKVTVLRQGLDALSGGKDPDVGIAVVPGLFTANAATPQKVSVNVSTTTTAAAFDKMPITLHIEDVADATKFVDVPFKLTVSSVLTITLTGNGKVGGTKHVFSTDAVSTLTAGSFGFKVRQRPVNNGTGGTTFVFLNKDTGAHEIHGAGQIAHQNPPGTAPNATYTVKNVNGLSSFYCHSDGVGSAVPGSDRDVTFIP